MSAGLTRVIIAGQSNTIYCPDTRVVTDPKYSPVVGVKAFTGFRGSFNSNANIKWKPWQDFAQTLYYPMTYTPLTNDRRWGSAMESMAYDLANKYGHTLSIVQWGEGSTGLATDWMPAGVGQKCYRELVHVNTIANASPYAPTLPPANRTILIWWQGENDAMDSTNSLAYQANWNTFIAQLRTDLGLPNLHVVMVKLNNGSSTTFKDNLRSQQVLIAGADAKVHLFDTDNRTLSGDGLHFPSTQAVLIGPDLATFIDGII